jgi:hypothetical protein
MEHSVLGVSTLIRRLQVPRETCGNLHNLVIRDSWAFFPFHVLSQPYRASVQGMRSLTTRTTSSYPLYKDSSSCRALRHRTVSHVQGDRILGLITGPINKRANPNLQQRFKFVLLTSVIDSVQQILEICV